MDFRYLDGNWRRTPSFLPCPGASLPDVHFARGGRLGGLTSGDLFRREMLKERIREELRQDMAERRMLEEEVRQEMEREVMQEVEMKRAMGLRQLPPMAPLALPPPARLALPLSAPLPMPHGGILVEPRLPVPGPRFVEVREESESPVRVRPVSKIWKEPAFSHTSSEPEVDEQEHNPEAKQFQRKNSGIKRKCAAVAETSKVKRTEGWGLCCALCQISATSKEGLNDHLQGKKHHAMVAKLASKDARNKNSSCVVSMPKRDEASASTPKAGATLPTEFSNGKKIAMQIDGKLHYVIQKNTFLICEPCGVECNSTMMMISHLGGKKHMGLSSCSSKFTNTATTNADAVEDVPVAESVEEEEA